MMGVRDGELFGDKRAAAALLSKSGVRLAGAVGAAAAGGARSSVSSPFFSSTSGCPPASRPPSPSAFSFAAAADA